MENLLEKKPVVYACASTTGWNWQLQTASKFTAVSLATGKPLLLIARPVRIVRNGRAGGRLVGRRVRIRPWLLQLGWRRSVRLRIAKRNGLRHGGRARTLLRRVGRRTTEVVRSINSRRNEEENLERILSDCLSLEEVAEDWNASHA